MVAEGEAGDLESLLAALTIKNTIINVVDIKSEYSSVTGDFESFVKVVSGGETDQRLDVAAELLTKLILVNEKILDEIRATRTELTETHEEGAALFDWHNGLYGHAHESWYAGEYEAGLRSGAKSLRLSRRVHRTSGDAVRSLLSRVCRHSFPLWIRDYN